MSEETPSEPAGEVTRPGGGPAQALRADWRKSLVGAVLLLAGATCLVIGNRAARANDVFFFLDEPNLRAGVLLVAIAAGAFAHPHVTRWRLRRRIREAGGEPWKDEGLWSDRLVIPLGRRGSSGWLHKHGRLVVSVGVPAVLAVLLVLVIVCTRSGLWAQAWMIPLVVMIAMALTLNWIVRRGTLGLGVGYASFPCFVGERVQIQLRLPADVFAGSKPPVPTLQCLRESRRDGGDWVSERLHLIQAADIWPIPETPDTYAVEFELPPDAPATDVLVLPAHSWQLVVSVETPAGWYDGVVAAPVFARAAPAAVSP